MSDNTLHVRTMPAQQSNRLPYAVAIAIFLLLPWLPINGFYLFLAQTFFYTAIAVTGLNLLLGLSGQMSIGQAGFYALGAYGSALTSLKLGWPVPLSITFGVLIAAIGGGLVGVFALRTRGLYLAMTTLAVGYILDIVGQRWISLTGGAMGLSGVPSLDLGFPKMSATVFFYVSGASLIVVQLLADFINQSRLGRNLRAIRESEVFAASVGVEVSLWKAAIFAFAAALAGLGGAFFAHQSGYVGSDAFSVRLSIAFLIATVVGGLGTKTGPLLGTLILLAIVEVIAGIDKYGLLIYGSILLIVLLAFPKGAAGVIDSLAQRFKSGASLAGATRDGSKPEQGGAGTGTPEGATVSDLASATSKADALPIQQSGNTSLSVQNISKSYSGLKAVDQVTVEVKPNTIHGLIGPNGAGKSTIINMIAGIYRADEGSIHLGDLDLSSLDIAKRANLGLARTFQNLQLIEGVSVLDNVLLGIAHKNSYSHDFVTWLSGGELEGNERKEAFAILEFFGLAQFAERLPTQLPYGHRKLIELARAIAQRPKMLLLDEPIAGMNTQEAKAIAQVITKLRSHGITILLVEHNMEFVMSVCDTISVLNFGKLIACGTPAEIQNNPEVIEAYLGTGAKK
ncbi:MAG: branched-chain amino acid ABC transporter ATP-binding protein/permease [Alcaligenaceae bacterium]|nr:branched-chain amino acid ABC transporter ATP-binding protein/permease [Alcaligenaceae bacterium]